MQCLKCAEPVVTSAVDAMPNKGHVSGDVLEGRSSGDAARKARCDSAGQMAIEAFVCVAAGGWLRPIVWLRTKGWGMQLPFLLPGR